MLRVNNTSISADSVIEKGDDVETIVSLTATLASDGTMSLSQFVQNTQLYKDNYDVVAADVEAFNTYVRNGFDATSMEATSISDDNTASGEEVNE